MAGYNSPPNQQMEYSTVNFFFKNIASLIFENRIIFGLIWLVAMFFLLKKLAKKDNDYILKKFTRNK